MSGEDQGTSALTEWRASGKRLLDAITEREAAAQEALDAIQAERYELENALGLRDPESGKPMKVMIRHVIKEVLLAAEGPLSDQQIVDEVQERQPKAKESSILTSLERALKTDDWCVKTEGEAVDGYIFQRSSNGQTGHATPANV